MWSLLCFLLLPQVWAAEKLEQRHVQVSWAMPERLGPGKQNIALVFSLEPGWHLYWKNPGDSGAAPRFTFKSSTASLQQLGWATPSRSSLGDLINFTHEGTVVFPFELIPKKKARSVALQVDLDWLVCKADCIPQSGSIDWVRPIDAKGPLWSQQAFLESGAKAEEVVAAALTDLPKSVAEAPFRINGVKQLQSGGAVLILEQLRPFAWRELELFPAESVWLGAQKPEWIVLGNKAYFSFTTIPGRAMPKEIKFLAHLKESWEFSAPVQAGSFILPESNQDVASLWILLLSAFAGGILLNLMPCVFPVLSLKAFGLLKTEQLAERLREAALYTLGILFSFAILGGVLLALRAGGVAIGWGFQLQSPWIVFALAALFFLMGLSFLGIFEFGTGIMNLAGRSSYAGAFGSGILAVFVAAPCTGPFMGAALGAAVIMPPLPALAIFLALGLGLASPYVAFSFSPGLHGLLPKPGIWMQRLREALSLPLFATVVWLLWVLAKQVGDSVWLLSLLVFSALTAGLYLWRRQKIWSAAIVAVSILVGVQQLQNFVQKAKATPIEVNTDDDWPAYSEKTSTEIQAWRAAGKGVFVDFTAAWCVTCQWNKRAVLQTSAAAALFQKYSVQKIRADWTRYDPTITAALAEWGRNSVPTYVYYPPLGQGEPRLLPQLLSWGMLEAAFRNQ